VEFRDKFVHSFFERILRIDEPVEFLWAVCEYFDYRFEEVYTLSPGEN
jgi:hypothetical protein